MVVIQVRIKRKDNMCAKFTLIEPHFHDVQFEPSMSIGDNEPETEESDEKSTAKKAIQGALVFVVMFAVLWVVLSRLTGSEEET